jgi:alkylation response protein AidB-like acyl-CoA dehydrogenase
VNFELSDEQRAWRDECHAFARDVMRPAAPQHDRDQTTPWDVLREARRRGLSGLDHLERIGSDPDGIFGAIYAEELHWGCAGIALAIAGSGLAASGILTSGTPEQIATWVPRCYGDGDDVRLGAYAVTEPGAGSDVRSLRTRAELHGDSWVLNGTKTFITNGGIADVTVVVATVDPSLGHRGQASFIVPAGTAGLSEARKEDKLGIRASHTAEIVLDDCRIPADHVLGGVDALQAKLARARAGDSEKGRSNALATFEMTRPFVGASALGIGRAAFEWTLDYLEGGGAGGSIDEQATQHALAEVATELDAARLLVWRAAWMARNGKLMTSGQGSMSKLKASEVTVWAVSALMDLVGPEAGSADLPLEKWLRDAKIYTIFEGTSQMQRTVIARLQRQSRTAERDSDESIPVAA